MGDQKLKIRKGDQVKIIAGKDKGKTGKILKVDTDNRKVIVEGLNMMKKTQRPKREGEKGQIVELEAPLTISKVMVICRKCGPTRIGFKIDAGKKSRICRKCGEAL